MRKEKVSHLRIFTLAIKKCKIKISCCDSILYDYVALCMALQGCVGFWSVVYGPENIFEGIALCQSV